MKKYKILIVLAIILSILYTVLLFLQIGDYKLGKVWFGLALEFIGIYSFFNFIIFKNDSSFYYAILLLLIGACSCYRQINEIAFVDFYSVYILCFAFASFAIFVFFRQNIHFKLFTFLSIEAILISVHKLKYLQLWQMFVINGVYLFLLLLNLIFRIKKNLRRIK